MDDYWGDGVTWSTRGEEFTKKSKFEDSIICFNGDDSIIGCKFEDSITGSSGVYFSGSIIGGNFELFKSG